MKQLLLSLALLFSTSLVFSQGNCNEVDLEYLAVNSELVQAVAATCGTDCLFAADPEACLLECMQAQVDLSNDCLGCFSEQVECATSNCFLACAFGSEEDCAACIAESCLASFNECAGIYDVDGDSWTTLNDCNDNDSSINPDAIEIWYDGIDQNCDGLSDYDQDMDGQDAVEFGGEDCDDLDDTVQGGAVTYFADLDQDTYGDLTNSILACSQPEGYVLDNNDCDDTNEFIYEGAPGTGEGIDNNCNGFLDGEEFLLCLGDFNNSGNVDAGDLLIFLTGFGCEAICTVDLDGDDTVGSSDLLVFLSNFGTGCQP
ncbi:MAG: putative metal-binding motif-containing protein [Flavobacteriales bacterium]